MEVSPFLSEVFRVNDNDFSITCEIAVKFSWIESRLNFTKEKNYSGHLDEELLDHIWLPKVEIRHLEKDVINTKSLLPQTVLGITVKKGVVWLEWGVNIKPTITCKMRFNWNPFDEQICSFVIQSIYDTNLVELVTIKHNGFFAPEYSETALLDYDLLLASFPEEEKLELGSGFDSHKDSYQTSSFTWSQSGFHFHLVRRWTRYIFIYYIPSALCVLASWASFLIGLDVLAGRSGLLVTLFLSLTAVLASSITSSPRVGSITALTAWIIIQYVFLILAIAAFAFIMAVKRYSKLNEEEFKKHEKKFDSYFLIIFPITYFIMIVLYWIVIGYNTR